MTDECKVHMLEDPTHWCTSECHIPCKVENSSACWVKCVEVMELFRTSSAQAVDQFSLVTNSSQLILRKGQKKVQGSQVTSATLRWDPTTYI